MFTLLNYVNEESDDVIGGSANTVQYSTGAIISDYDGSCSQSRISLEILEQCSLNLAPEMLGQCSLNLAPEMYINM